MTEFDTIYLSWRKGQGSRRVLVGKIERQTNGKYIFQYDQAAVAEAKKEGFSPYTEFPDITKEYNGTVLDVFAQRLMKSERPDIHSFYKFWEIAPDKQNDKFYLLGHTQGLLPTDNFEFLADYQLVDGLGFLTELASLSQQQLPPDAVKQGDELRFEIEPDNPYDREAVKVFKGSTMLGYIKQVHCRVFHQPGADRLKLTAKAVEKNGVLKRVFVKVSF
jgi:hypothetical protein